MASDDDKTFAHAWTAAGYKFASLAVNLTPGPVAQFMSGVAGNGLALAMRDRRHMVERHLQRVNPSLTGWALRRAVQSSFDSYARYWVDCFRVPNLPKRVVERGFTIVGFEHVEASVAAGHGTILALPHLGGWEWAGRWITDRGFKLTVVVEPLENEELFEWFRDLRAELGMTVVPLGPEAGGAVLRALKDNEVVCLLCDRDIQGGGVEVEFFGETTTLPAGPATLSIRTGAPIIPAAAYFTEEYNGHSTVVRPPVPTTRRGSLREDVRRVTQALARELELLIRTAPEQWHMFQPNWPSDPGYATRGD